VDGITNLRGQVTKAIKFSSFTADSWRNQPKKFKFKKQNKILSIEDEDLFDQT